MKHRGKKFDNEWVYGYLLCDWLNNKHIATEFGPNITQCSECGSNKIITHPVIHKTIGHFIGLKDKKDADIYTDDIVNIKTAQYTFPEAIISFNKKHARYVAKATNKEIWPITVCEIPIDEDWDIEVIGNIHERKDD